MRREKKIFTLLIEDVTLKKRFHYSTFLLYSDILI